MARVRLEIDQITIHRPKQRWKLYFVVMAEHPTDGTKMVVSVIPSDPILVVPQQGNVVTFEQQNNAGSEGFFVLSREMPSNRELNVHFFVRHSRRSIHDVGAILADIESGIGSKAFGLLSDILGTTNPWLIIAKSAIPLVGQILEKIPDRDMGFISMFERFGKEFENQTELDRESRGGNVTVIHSWSVDTLI